MKEILKTQAIYIAIAGFICGAIIETGISYAWKRYQDPEEKFNSIYFLSMLISILLTVLLSPLLLIGNLPTDASELYTIITMGAVGFTANAILNKPISYVIKNWPSKIEPKKLWVIAVSIILIACLGGATVYAAQVYNYKIGSTGTISTVGCSVYSNQAGTNILTSIAWGALSPGQVAPQMLYIKNTGNTPVTLVLSTSNYAPANAEQYLTLTWNYTGTPIASGQIIPVQTSLSVSSSISGITNFSFDIFITATG